MGGLNSSNMADAVVEEEKWITIIGHAGELMSDGGPETRDLVCAP